MYWYKKKYAMVDDKHKIYNFRLKKKYILIRLQKEELKITVLLLSLYKFKGICIANIMHLASELNMKRNI